MTTTLGVLVAGGAGARLGAGVPKALATLGGITLLERGVATLASVCDQVAVATPATLDFRIPLRLRTTCGASPRRVDDRPGPSGPLAGIVAGLSAMPFERALVLGVDFPLIEPAFLVALLDRLEGYAAVVPAPGGIAQPLAAAYAPVAAEILASCHAAGEGAPSRALGSLAVRRLDDAELERMPGGTACLFNLNTAADRAEAERRLSARAASR